jgi:hypothetical protein
VTDQAPAPTPADATMSVARANALALLWLPVAVALVLGPFVLIWGLRALGTGVVRLLPLAVIVPGIAGGIVAHELLHAAGFLAFGRVPRRDVRVGVHRRTLTPYATCRAPVAAAAYRAAALLPAVGLGVVPGVVSVVTGAGWLAAWAALMLALAGGDLAAVWAIRRLPPATSVLDHPTRVGCTVVRT